MSLFVPVPNTAQFSVIFSQQGQVVENVYHVKQAAPWDVTAMTSMAAILRNWWNTSMKAFIPTTVKLTQINAVSLETSTAPGIEYVTSMPITGGGLPDESPMNVTIAVKWLTGLRGRSYRGRTYHVGLSPSQIAGSIVFSSYIASIQGAYSTLIDDVHAYGADVYLSVVSRRLNKLPRTPGVATTIISCAIEPTVDSQRRRLPGRGR